MPREFTYTTTEGDLSWIEGGGWSGADAMVERVEEYVAAAVMLPRTVTGPDVEASTVEFVGAFTVAGLVAREFALDVWGDGYVEFVGSRPPPLRAVEGIVY